jgi:hypothetical protein
MRNKNLVHPWRGLDAGRAFMRKDPAWEHCTVPAPIEPPGEREMGDVIASLLQGSYYPRIQGGEE